VSCTRFVKHYIGETEKNVSSLLARAETKNWIMFFNDVDALFKAYSPKESNDKDLLNIRRAYLIKQMSAYSGLVVLSINTRACLDSVFFATDVKSVRDMIEIMPKKDEMN
jgi:SpoVK/Ycf46/Vps4 family AAA+-type ATPase